MSAISFFDFFLSLCSAVREATGRAASCTELVPFFEFSSYKKLLFKRDPCFLRYKS